VIPSKIKSVDTSIGGYHAMVDELPRTELPDEKLAAEKNS
jgi:hypothetical protein